MSVELPVVTLPVPPRPGGSVDWQLREHVYVSCPHVSADHPAMACTERWVERVPTWYDPAWRQRGRAVSLDETDEPEGAVLATTERAAPIPFAAAPKNAAKLARDLWLLGRPPMLVRSTLSVVREVRLTAGERPKDVKKSNERKTKRVPWDREIVGVIVPRLVICQWVRWAGGTWTTNEEGTRIMRSDGSIEPVGYTEIAAHVKAALEKGSTL